MLQFHKFLYWFAAVLMPLLNLSCRYPPQTSTSSAAHRAEVKFISLPADACAVRFWDDGNNQMVTFKASEAEFRAMFGSKIGFAEITKPTFYYSERYGDAKNPPWKQGRDVVAGNGIVFDVSGKGGSGVTAIYDRDKGLGFFYRCRW